MWPGGSILTVSGIGFRGRLRSRRMMSVWHCPGGTGSLARCWGKSAGRKIRFCRQRSFWPLRGRKEGMPGSGLSGVRKCWTWPGRCWCRPSTMTDISALPAERVRDSGGIAPASWRWRQGSFWMRPWLLHRRRSRGANRRKAAAFRISGSGWWTLWEAVAVLRPGLTWGWSRAFRICGS